MLSEGDGRRPKGDGPPDLEELWQDFNRRLSALFGGRNRGGGPFRGGGMASAGIAIAGVAAAMLVVWLLSGFYQVPEGSAAVVLRFGKYATTTGPGLWYHYPSPIESAEKVAMSTIHNVDVGRISMLPDTNIRDSSMLTADQDIIDISFSVQYLVKDAAEYKFNQVDPDATVLQAAQSAVRQQVGAATMERLLTDGREKLKGDLRQSIQAILDAEHTGVEVTQVSLSSVQVPEPVQGAFEDASRAIQDEERSKNDGQTYANNVIPRAQGEAARILAEAEGYKSRVIDEAQGEAERFKQVLAEYAKAPQVTRDRMYLQTMQDIYSNTTKLFIDSHSSNNVINVPLERGVEPARGAAPLPAPGTSGAAAATPPSVLPAPVDEARARDAAHSREREGRP